MTAAHLIKLVAEVLLVAELVLRAPMVIAFLIDPPQAAPGTIETWIALWLIWMVALIVLYAWASGLEAVLDIRRAVVARLTKRRS